MTARRLGRFAAVIAIGGAWFWLVNRFVVQPRVIDRTYAEMLAAWPPFILFAREVLIWANDYSQALKQPLRDAAAALGLRNWQIGERVELPAFALIHWANINDYFEGEWQGVPVQVVHWEWQSMKGGGGSFRLVLLARFVRNLPPGAFGREGSREWEDSDWKKIAPYVSGVDRAWRVFTPDGQWRLGPELGPWLGTRRPPKPAYETASWSFQCAGPFVAASFYPQDFTVEAMRKWLDEGLEEARGFAAHAADVPMGEGVSVGVVRLRNARSWMRKVE